MKPTLIKTNLCLGRIALGLFCVALLLALFTGVSQERHYLNSFVLTIGFLLFLLAARYLFTRYSRRIKPLGTLHIWLLLTVFCLLVKGGYILIVRVVPAGDYATFWGYANSLASREVIFGGRYLALFPHLFGYSAFLSWFIRLFGAVPLLAPILNVLLTACSGSLLFRIGLRLSSRHTAAIAYLLWILCPSQTIYNSLILSEPLYTTGILAFLLIVAEGYLRIKTASKPLALAAVLGILAGAVLAAVNLTRPVGLILIFALFLWLACLNTELFLQKASRRPWLLFVALLMVVYLAAGQIAHAHITHRLGEEPSGFPGFNLLVGFQTESDGRWNEADSALLNHYNSIPGLSASDVQHQMLEEAEARISSGTIDFPQLFQNKFRIFLGSDDACVGYSDSVLSHTNWFSHACNGFYYATLLLAALGAVRLWRDKQRSPLLLAPIYFLGLALAQMLVEVAGRYHYSLIPVLILLSAYALNPAQKGICSPYQE